MSTGAITLKRLGIYLQPIVLVNTRGFFDALVRLFERCVTERFMDARHLSMFQVVSAAEDVPDAIRTAAPWSHDARQFAGL